MVQQSSTFQSICKKSKIKPKRSNNYKFRTTFKSKRIFFIENGTNLFQLFIYSLISKGRSAVLQYLMKTPCTMRRRFRYVRALVAMLSRLHLVFKPARRQREFLQKVTSAEFISFFSFERFYWKWEYRNSDILQFQKELLLWNLSSNWKCIFIFLSNYYVFENIINIEQSRLKRYYKIFHIFDYSYL